MAQENSKNKRGAPFGNQNARTHGFYSKKMASKEKLVLEAASDLSGLDQEITLLRSVIKSILDSNPVNYDLLLKAFWALTRMIKTKDALKGDSEERHAEAMRDYFGQTLAPAGYWPVLNESGEFDVIRISSDEPAKTEASGASTAEIKCPEAGGNGADFKED